MQQAVAQSSIVSAPRPTPLTDLRQVAGVASSEVAAARVGEELVGCLQPPASGQPVANSCTLPALELDSSSYSQQEFHVLLVDDDLVTLRAVEQLLRRTGYKVTTATNGRDAIKHLVANKSGAYGTPIDLVLTDILMPEVSGFDLMHEVMHGTMFSEVPVVVMSGVDSQESVLKAFEAGAADYLIKPLRRNEVATLWQHVWRANRYKATLHNAGVIHSGLALDNNHTVNQASAQQAAGTSMAAAGAVAAGNCGHPQHLQLSGGPHSNTNGTKNGSSGASTSIAADQSTMMTTCTHDTSAFAAKQGSGVGCANTDHLQGSGQSNNTGNHATYTTVGVDASHTGPTSLACRGMPQQDWDAPCKDAVGASGTAMQAYNRHATRLDASHTSRLGVGAAADTCTDAGTSTSMDDDEDAEGRATSPMTLAPTKLQPNQQLPTSGSQPEVQQEQETAAPSKHAASTGQVLGGSCGAMATQTDNMPAGSTQPGRMMSGDGGGSGSIFSAAGRPTQQYTDSVHHSPHSVISARDHQLPSAANGFKSEGGPACLPKERPGAQTASATVDASNGAHVHSIARPTPGRSSSLATNGSSETAVVGTASATLDHLPRALKELAALGHQMQLEREAARNQQAEHKAISARMAPGNRLQPPYQPANAVRDGEQQQQQQQQQQQERRAEVNSVHGQWQTEEDAEAAEAAGLLLGVAAAAAAEQEAARWAAEKQLAGPAVARGGLRSTGSSFTRANNGYNHSNKRAHHSLPTPNTREAAASIAAANAAASMALSALTVILPRSNNNRVAGSPQGSGAAGSPGTAGTTDTSKQLLPFPCDAIFSEGNTSSRVQPHATQQVRGADSSVGLLDPSKSIVSLPSAASPADSKPTTGVGVGQEGPGPLLPPPEPLVLDGDASRPATGVPAGPHPIYLHPPSHPQLLLPQSVVPLLAYSFAGMHPELAPHLFIGAARPAAVGIPDGVAGACAMDCAPPHVVPPVHAGAYPSVVLVAGRSDASTAAAHRRAAVQKYLQKKKNRNFKKKVRYESRKRLAEARPRVRGQFVKQETLAATLQQVAVATGTSNGAPQPGTQGSPQHTGGSQVQAGTASTGASGGATANAVQTRAPSARRGQSVVQPAQNGVQHRVRVPKRHRADEDEDDEDEEQEELAASGEDEEVDGEDSDE